MDRGDWWVAYSPWHGKESDTTEQLTQVYPQDALLVNLISHSFSIERTATLYSGLH